MIEHVVELGNTDFWPPTTADTCTAEYQSKLEAVRKPGIRIRARLRDLVDEYDEVIRKCRHMMEMTTLSTQRVVQLKQPPTPFSPLVQLLPSS